MRTPRQLLRLLFKSKLGEMYLGERQVHPCPAQESADFRVKRLDFARVATGFQRVTIALWSATAAPPTRCWGGGSINCFRIFAIFDGGWARATLDDELRAAGSRTRDHERGWLRRPPPLRLHALHRDRHATLLRFDLRTGIIHPLRPMGTKVIQIFFKSMTLRYYSGLVPAESGKKPILCPDDALDSRKRDPGASPTAVAFDPAPDCRCHRRSTGAGGIRPLTRDRRSRTGDG